MARPYTKDYRREKRLAFYVDGLLSQVDDDELLASKDPLVRNLAAQALLEKEPRLWKLPRDFVREFIVLPSIAQVEGLSAADAIRKAPLLLAEYVDLVCDRARQDTPASQRLKPERDVAWLVELVMVAALFDGYDPGLTYNSNLMRAVNRVGASRHAVARASKKFRRFAGQLGQPERTNVIGALNTISELMAALDRGELCPSVRIAKAG